MRIGLGNDHVALDLKKDIMVYLQDKGYECIDYGTNTYERTNYPKYGLRVAEALINDDIDKGILICGTGVGISLSANKVPGIRAAVCSEPYTARLSVQHNNANILAFGARVVGLDLAKMIVDEFLNSRFEGERHKIRIDMIKSIEEKYSK